MFELFTKIKRKLNSYNVDQDKRAFIKHNLRCFPNITKSTNSLDPEVLFEFNSCHNAHISYAYLANILATKFEARITAFTSAGLLSLWRKYEWILSSYFNIREFAVYRSFGVSRFLQPKLNSNQKKRARILTNQFLTKLQTKSDIESICVNEVLIGDLIYDSYLRTFNKPTVNLKDKHFKKFLLNGISLYVYWNDYFKNHNVVAVNVSHCVYTLAIPMRIAVSMGIPSFQINATHAYRLDKKNLFAYSDYKCFKEKFRNLSYEVQQKGMEKAKERIELRFSGKVGVDMAYSTKSAYGQHRPERIIKKSDRIKVLIATHCFFDSPHGYGNNLFPDFYEWLDFLGEMTLETDYDWYMKTHPDYLDGTMEVIQLLVKKYPKFHLLPAESSHHQIIDEGINVALTTFGTIGFEYAALGIPVINASLNNPHIAYNFNLHPENIDEYRGLLLNLSDIELNIDLNEVYEYYFMKFISEDYNWLFNNYMQMEKELGGYTEQFTSKVYGAWISEWSPQKHTELISILNSFIDSGDFRLENKGQE